MSARHRLGKLLLRQGILWSGGRAWTGPHDAWLRRQRFDNPARQLAFESAYETVAMTLARRDRLDAAIEAMAADSQFTPIVRRLGCLRGIATLTGFTLAVEIGDWNRFTGSAIGGYVGLTPSESSSGASRSQGPITKTGNTHVRRLLVEAAWHHRRRLQHPVQRVPRLRDSPVNQSAPANPRRTSDRRSVARTGRRHRLAGDHRQPGHRRGPK